MPYLLFLKNSKIWKCHLLQIIGGAVRVNRGSVQAPLPQTTNYSMANVEQTSIMTLSLSGQ